LIKPISRNVLLLIIHKTANITEVGNCCINTTRDFCIKRATCTVQIEKSIFQCKDTDILAKKDRTSFVLMANYYTLENKTCKLNWSFKRYFMLHSSTSSLTHCHRVTRKRVIALPCVSDVSRVSCFLTWHHALASVSWSGSLIASTLSTAWCRTLGSEVTNKQTSPDTIFLEW